MKPRYVPQVSGVVWSLVWLVRSAFQVVIVAFALALIAYLTSLLGGCGASASDHAFAATAAACDQAELEAGDDEGKIACVREVCDAVLTEIDADAAEDLHAAE